MWTSLGRWFDSGSKEVPDSFCPILHQEGRWRPAPSPTAAAPALGPPCSIAIAAASLSQAKARKASPFHRHRDWTGRDGPGRAGPGRPAAAVTREHTPACCPHSTHTRTHTRTHAHPCPVAHNPSPWLLPYGVASTKLRALSPFLHPALRLPLPLPSAASATTPPLCSVYLHSKLPATQVGPGEPSTASSGG